MVRCAFLAAVLLWAVSACVATTGPTAIPEAPTPTCRAVTDDALDPGALSCPELAHIALRTLTERAPDHVRRGVVAIDILRTDCPRGEMPPLIDCTGVDNIQLATVRFGAARADGPIEEELTVAIEPFTGRVLGIANPLIR